ncbi:MAG: SAM-dependent methyltransferase [Clostridia bacterium]|nr:SAM-dependent methyltransferase [Clostridia bacterium]
MREITLSKRLSAAASLVRSGAVCADIGTDHAYIPISLVSENRVTHVIASDVNEGPIRIAKENIKSCGLEDKITVTVANGLDGIEKYSPTDILICGMGGELIVKILNASEYIKKQGVRLILQPMTSVKELREYLKNGFNIVEEIIALDSNKLYQIICAEYDGKKREYTDAELELGKINIAKKEPLFYELHKRLVEKRKKRLNGLKEGGYPTECIEMEIKELESII